jgi:hypothetical protein
LRGQQSARSMPPRREVRGSSLAAHVNGKDSCAGALRSRACNASELSSPGMVVGCHHKRLRLLHVALESDEIAEADPLVSAHLQNALDVAYAQTGNAQKRFPCRAVDVDREMLAMSECPGKLGIDFEVELSAAALVRTARQR